MDGISCPIFVNYIWPSWINSYIFVLGTRITELNKSNSIAKTFGEFKVLKIGKDQSGFGIWKIISLQNNKKNKKQNKKSKNKNVDATVTVTTPKELLARSLLRDPQ